MREDVSFDSKGLKCRGWLYLPDNVEDESTFPIVLMAHGLSGVKEQALPDFAERFIDAGLAALVFDYRYFGDSEGEPRCQLLPLEQVEDYRNAITWVSEHPRIDPERIGVWGTSFSGGLAAYVGTFDSRVRAVVAQNPALTNAETRRAMDPERWDNVGELLLQDRIARYKTGTVNYMNVVAPEGEPCILPGQEPYDAFMELWDMAPNWRNEITLESLEKIREFDAVSQIHLMAPTALLVIPAEHDSLIPLDSVKRAYEKAGDPKELLTLPIRHFDIYKDPWLSQAAAAAVDWFRKYLD